MAAPPERPWLSLLLPVYNVEPWLRECVESVLQQADAGVEVLLYDDVSTDGSLTLAEQLQAEHPARVQLLRGQRNGGLSFARNRLLEAARGEWLWFLDSDDRLEPGAIPALRRALTAHPDLDLVFCDFRDLRERQRLKHRLRGENHRRTQAIDPGRPCSDRSALVQGMYLQGHLHSWSKIARRELWGADLRFPEGRCFEDMATSPYLLLRARRALYLSEVWVAYRKRPGSILSSMNLSKCDDMLAAHAGLADALQAQGLSHGALAAAAHFQAKAFVVASQVAERAGDGARLQRYREAFLRQLPLPLVELQAFYLRQGWLWRALRLRHWLRRTAHPKPIPRP